MVDPMGVEPMSGTFSISSHSQVCLSTSPLSRIATNHTGSMLPRTPPFQGAISDLVYFGGISHLSQIGKKVLSTSRIMLLERLRNDYCY